LVTAISILGRVKQSSWSLASSSRNQSVSAVTRSPASRRMMTSSDSPIMRLVSRESMPYIAASVGSAPGPTPNIVRPRVM
jgi:hypothetical protein